jgi:LemA protein
MPSRTHARSTTPAPAPAPHRRGAIQKGCLIAVLGVGLLALLGAMVFAGKYNSLQTGKTRVEAKVGEMDSQYKRRFDLIPNLVETVKGAASFEQETLQAVVDARASVGRAELPRNLDPQKLQAYIQAQQGLGAALGRLFAVAENYPQLRATESFRELQVQVEGTENRINAARIDYINAIQAYNAELRRFPGNVIGGLFGFEELPQFASEPEAREVPKIDFGKKE